MRACERKTSILNLIIRGYCRVLENLCPTCIRDTEEMECKLRWAGTCVHVEPRLQYPFRSAAQGPVAYRANDKSVGFNFGWIVSSLIENKLDGGGDTFSSKPGFSFCIYFFPSQE